MNDNTYEYIAIDISKAALEVKCESLSFSVSNDEEGLTSLMDSINIEQKPLIVCEATGGYERALLRFMEDRNIPVKLLNPGWVRAFAKSEGVKAKTDPIDAQMLLKFAQSKQLQPDQAKDSAARELSELVDRRRHLSEQGVREKNRIQNSPHAIQDSAKRMLDAIEKELIRIEMAIRKFIQNNPILKEKFRLLLSIKGVGEITAWSMLAYLPELGRMKRNKLVALAGLAPYNRDSGKRVGDRAIEGGRFKVRRALYMAAHTAGIHNTVIQQYVEGLQKRGKPYKCAMVAAMRKLLIHMQAVLRNGISEFS